MKKVLPFLVIVALFLVAACGGDDATDEPTATVEPTAPPTVETAPTPPPTEPECNNYYWFDNDSTECGQKEFCGAFMYQGLQTFGTQAECETALAAISTPPPPTPPPPTQGSDAVEDVLADVMAKLVVAIAEVDGQWQSYTKADGSAMSTLSQGGGYYFFTTESTTIGDIDLPEGPSGMAPKIWMGDTISANTVLINFKDSVLIAIGFDNATKNWTLYQSQTVTDLTEIPNGQTYYVFEADPASPVTASWNSYTR